MAHCRCGSSAPDLAFTLRADAAVPQLVGQNLSRLLAEAANQTPIDVLPASSEAERETGRCSSGTTSVGSEAIGPPLPRPR